LAVHAADPWSECQGLQGSDASYTTTLRAVRRSACNPALSSLQLQRKAKALQAKTIMYLPEIQIHGWRLAQPQQAGTEQEASRGEAVTGGSEARWVAQ
jgi:hypothetical protein